MAARYPKQTDMEVPLLMSIVHRGGQIWFSVHGNEIEEELADLFGLPDFLREYASPEINAKGHRKWRNIIQFVRRRLVDHGEMDNSTRDLWKVTDKGYRRLGLAHEPSSDALRAPSVPSMTQGRA